MLLVCKHSLVHFKLHVVHVTLACEIIDLLLLPGLLLSHDVVGGAFESLMNLLQFVIHALLIIELDFRLDNQNVLKVHVQILAFQKQSEVCEDAHLAVHG